MPKVSIIIPTYNQAGLLREALSSIKAQTELDWEAIIINNYSDDETIATIEHFSEPRFRYFNIHNQGIIARSRNEGLRHAKSDWIAFLDSDDLWMPNKLSVSLTVAQDYDLISHREVTIKDGKIINASPHYTPGHAAYRRLLFKGNCFSPSALLVRRRLLKKVGGFSEASSIVTCEDYDLWLRLSAQGARCYFIDSVLSSYRLHDGNNSASVCRHMKAGLTVIDSHFNSLAPKLRWDWIRYRRQKALIIYSAGRSFQNSGDYRAACRFFGRSFIMYPLLLRTLVCGIAALLGFNVTKKMVSQVHFDNYLSRSVKM